MKFNAQKTKRAIDATSNLRQNRERAQKKAESAELYLHGYLFELLDHLDAIEGFSASDVGWLIASLANENVIEALEQIHTFDKM